ncbi:hypothetical protein BC938DRAFT_482512 [Jimgerdemannia flammicorona]|uniref:RRM domain-containing protein n=1 Tax=Jimgerdemannia flammicorona TaxID=994334 RepID=A0A433QDY7_9FUNG|nr:hypothetical protein BC938DRAFT_482512 [Jimgerdemannia flammicorona]
MDKQRKNRNSPYSRPTEGQWSHDMFDDRNSRDQNRRATGDVMSRLGGSSRADRNSAGTNNKLIVENLFYEVTQIDVQELFEQVGPVRRTFLQFDRSGRSTGVAEVTFENPEDAARALKTYNNLDLDNQPMRIKFAPLTSNPSSAHQSHGGGRNGTASGSIFSRLGPTANSRSGGSTSCISLTIAPHRLAGATETVGATEMEGATGMVVAIGMAELAGEEVGVVGSRGVDVVQDEMLGDLDRNRRSQRRRRS